MASSPSQSDLPNENVMSQRSNAQRPLRLLHSQQGTSQSDDSFSAYLHDNLSSTPSPTHSVSSEQPASPSHRAPLLQRDFKHDLTRSRSRAVAPSSEASSTTARVDAAASNLSLGAASTTPNTTAATADVDATAALRHGALDELPALYNGPPSSQSASQQIVPRSSSTNAVTASASQASSTTWPANRDGGQRSSNDDEKDDARSATSQPNGSSGDGGGEESQISALEPATGWSQAQLLEGAEDDDIDELEGGSDDERVVQQYQQFNLEARNARQHVKSSPAYESHARLQPDGGSSYPSWEDDSDVSLDCDELQADSDEEEYEREGSRGEDAQPFGVKNEAPAEARTHLGGPGAGSKKRRRTRKEEVEILASVYAQTPFPDTETRQHLADRLGMTVRAVSIWFQNRRQAMKKRATRYGGPNGIDAYGNATGSAPPRGAANGSRQWPSLDNAVEARAASPEPCLSSAAASPIKPSTVTASLQQRQAAMALQSVAAVQQHVDPHAVNELAEADVDADKENVAPITTSAAASLITAAVAPQAAPSRGFGRVVSAPVMARGRAPLRDLNDVVLGAGSLPALPPRNPLSPESDEEDDIVVPSKRRLGLGSRGMTRKPSMNDVLEARSKRTAFTRSVSLRVTASGRAAVGPEGTVPNAQQDALSLDARLPPKLAAALRAQGILPSNSDAKPKRGRRDSDVDVEGVDLWRRMLSSSASSEATDAEMQHANGAQPEREEGVEEDEERTLRLVANRRAAKLRERSAASNACVAVMHARAFFPSNPHQRAIAPMRSGKANVKPRAMGTETEEVNGAPMQSSDHASSTPRAPRYRVPSLDMTAGFDRAQSSLPSGTSDATHPYAAESSPTTSVSTHSASNNAEAARGKKRAAPPQPMPPRQQAVDENGLALQAPTHYVPRKRSRFAMDYAWEEIQPRIDHAEAAVGQEMQRMGAPLVQHAPSRAASVTSGGKPRQKAVRRSKFSGTQPDLRTFGEDVSNLPSPSHGMPAPSSHAMMMQQHAAQRTLPPLPTSGFSRSLTAPNAGSAIHLPPISVLQQGARSRRSGAMIDGIGGNGSSSPGYAGFSSEYPANMHHRQQHNAGLPVGRYGYEASSSRDNYAASLAEHQRRAPGAHTWTSAAPHAPGPMPFARSLSTGNMTASQRTPMSRRGKSDVQVQTPTHEALHDDSGFFGSDSERGSVRARHAKGAQPSGAGAAGYASDDDTSVSLSCGDSSMPASPVRAHTDGTDRTTRSRTRTLSNSPRKGAAADALRTLASQRAMHGAAGAGADFDRQAAELLLGLGREA